MENNKTTILEQCLTPLCILKFNLFLTKRLLAIVGSGCVCPKMRLYLLEQEERDGQAQITAARLHKGVAIEG